MKNKTHRKTPPTRLCVCVAGVLVLAVFGLSSCNVTRVVTNESSYFQKGDTATCITVKTVESYDAVKRAPKL